MENKFIITPKNEKTTTITVRINEKTNNILEELSLKSGRSRNEIINLALKFALDNMELADE